MNAPSTGLDNTETYEQRRFNRHSVALTVAVWLTDPNDCEERVNRVMLSQPRTAFIEDLSMSGLRLTSSASFPIRSVVGIRLRLGAQTFQVEALVQRRTARQVSGKRCYECGVQFVRSKETPEALIHIANYLKGEQGALTLVNAAPAAPSPDCPPPDCPSHPDSTLELLYPPSATAASPSKKYPWE